MGSNFWQAFKVFNLFGSLENETMEIFSIGEQTKNKHKFGGLKVCNANKAR